jgi:hypothetical protein
MIHQVSLNLQQKYYSRFEKYQLMEKAKKHDLKDGSSLQKFRDVGDGLH